MDGAGRRARRRARRAARREPLALLAAAVRRAGRRARPAERALALRGRAADRRGARGAARPRPRAWARRALGPHLDDVAHPRRRPRPAQLRLAGRAAAGRARAAARRGGRCSPSAAACRPLLLLDDVLSELDAGRRAALAERARRRRPDARHRDEPRTRCPRRAGPARRGDARERRGASVIEPIGGEVRRELARASARRPGCGVARRAWPARSARRIARNAWPARLAARRDAARRDELVRLGVRAHAARAARSSTRLRGGLGDGARRRAALRCRAALPEPPARTAPAEAGRAASAGARRRQAVAGGRSELAARDRGRRRLRRARRAEPPRRASQGPATDRSV